MGKRKRRERSKRGGRRVTRDGGRGENEGREKESERASERLRKRDGVVIRYSSLDIGKD